MTNKPYSRRAVKALPSVPKIGNEAARGYGQQRRWSKRCSYCNSTGSMWAIGGTVPCPHCCPTTDAQARQAEAEHEERQRGVTE